MSALMSNKTNSNFISGWENRAKDVIELFFDNDGERSH
jgi:hypothetical protein